MPKIRHRYGVEFSFFYKIISFALHISPSFSSTIKSSSRRRWALHDRRVSLGPDNLEDPVLNLPQPLLFLDNIQRILSPNQKLRTTWVLSPPRLSILCQRIRRERSSIGSVLDIHTNIGDHVRSVHGADMCKESVEMSELDTRKISNQSF